MVPKWVRVGNKPKSDSTLLRASNPCGAKQTDEIKKVFGGWNDRRVGGQLKKQLKNCTQQ